jgi:hypothetical protein
MYEYPNANSNYGPYGAPPSDPYAVSPNGPYNPPPSDPYGMPPHGSYNMPPNDPYGVPPTRPLPLGEAIRRLPGQYFYVLTNPGASVFAHEQGKAAWDITWVQIMLSSVVAALVGLVKFNTTVLNWLVHGHVSNGTLELLRAFSSAFALGYIILAPIFFFIIVGFYHLLARALGGKGTFLAYSYSTLLYTVPISIISGVLGIASSHFNLLSPFISFITSALGIYSLILSICMTIGVHRLSAARAILAVLVIPISLIVLFVVLLIGGLIFLFSSHPH